MSKANGPLPLVYSEPERTIVIHDESEPAAVQEQVALLVTTCTVTRCALLDASARAGVKEKQAADGAGVGVGVGAGAGVGLGLVDGLLLPPPQAMSNREAQDTNVRTIQEEELD